MPRNSPRKDPEEKMKSVVNLKLTEDLKVRLHETADKENLTVSRIIREGAEARIRFGKLILVEPKFVKAVPLVMNVPCGEPDDLDDLIQAIGESSDVEVTDELADCVTENSFAARADGWSMNDDHAVTGIFPGDWLLLTPLYEYPRDVKNGDIVLAKIFYNNGSIRCTLKEYQGTRLKPRNPNFDAIDFGPDVKRAVVWAVARGKLRQQVRFG